MNLDNLPEYQTAQLIAIQNTQDLRDLDNLRVELLGQKGSITALLKGLGALSPEERKAAGAQINVVKAAFQSAIETRKQHFEAALVAAQLESERIDVTLAGRGVGGGALHPLTLTLQRMQNILQNMGFEIADGPEIEDDWHNFTALNVPAEHPARAMHDTFYMANIADRLLRTHTSSVQIRFMRENTPPIRMVALGRVYRCDSDRTHSPMFHQIEGLYVAERASVSFADLKADLQDFMSAFFGREIVLQFRPSYFPFTEPSAEVDMAWQQPDGSTKWLEILGCGMVHPNVLKGVGIDPEKYSGYAFGLGVDRFAMLYYGVDDLRLLYENDLRLLSQFV